MKFTKMQGLGNDYVYVNCLEEKISNGPEIARLVSQRHFGIGSDGLILICPSDKADFQMVMYNADGSRAQMCGNGIRCVGKYVHDRGLTDKETFTVETLGGIKTLSLQVVKGVTQAVTVDMGEPVLAPAAVPVRYEGRAMVDRPLTVLGKTYRLTALSMGNPHGVVFLPEVEQLDLSRLGPAFEHHEIFPDRVNTEFVTVESPTLLRMRVWERGSGETMACGTGACAVLVAACLTGRAGPQATVRLLGGDLEISWDKKTNHVFMTGPAEFVFEGEIALG